MAGTHKAGIKEERILVCLSTSPSNKKVIEAAAKMADAFHADLTAIYVKPPDFEDMSEADSVRLQSNYRFAEQCGATITTVIGNDIPAQIAEYAFVSGTTKIVIGRTGAGRQQLWGKRSLTEQITLYVPDVDMYIIPDSAADLQYRKESLLRTGRLRPKWRDMLLALLLLAGSTAFGFIFMRLGFSESNIITVYILGVLIVSVITVSPVFGAVNSLASVLLFNYFFIEPRFSFHTYEPEYAVTFVIMLISSLITGTLANRLKENARHYALEAFRAKVLFDTNQLLQKASDADEVIQITARQVITLLNRDVMIYPEAEKDHPGAGRLFPADHSDSVPIQTKTREAGVLYQELSLNGYHYGLIGIKGKEKPLEAFEYSVFNSILGECTLALESLRNAQEKEQAAIIAQNEQLRANLLRSISHDIRTPLTSISGNASNLLSHYRQLDDAAREQIFTDIYDDSRWLINLTENLLSISRIENGQMNLHLSVNVVSEVIEEALSHIDRNSINHKIIVKSSEELLLARMDAALIVQVLVNLINNAVKNTPSGSEICISGRKADHAVQISVCDNGPGIPDEIKPHIFEMFYTGPGKVADGRRGLGLGLALCRSIVEAHKGTIALTDNVPSGCCFSFTLPAEEVMLHE